jgi:CheY-like chemotaxis protein/HPt (histidine-containing phosphotransfer) domain-containing protein
MQLGDLFREINVECDVAADGFKALELIEERGTYDIYFIDWRMPGMDGIELTKKIRGYKNGGPSVVIMITAMDWEKIKDDAQEAGVNKHMLKPLFSSTIIDIINECLQTGGIEAPDDEFIKNEFEGKKLLLAEDIEINRVILKKYLEDTGILIDDAENGQEALDMVEANPGVYDLVFMDVQMPKMDGLDATRRIRALSDPCAASVPIVAMTANVFKSDIEECLEAGMNGHIGKPVDIEKVFEALRKYLLNEDSKKGDVNAAKVAMPRVVVPRVAPQLEISPQIASSFVRDAVKAIMVLEKILEKSDLSGEGKSDLSDEDWKEYTIFTHGMKSALGNVGKKEQSKMAAELEAIGKNKDFKAMIQNTPPFLDVLREVCEELTPSKDAVNLAASPEEEDQTALKECLNAIKEACDIYDSNKAEALLNELKEKPWTSETNDLLDSIGELLLFSEFDEIIEIVNKINDK